MESSEIISTIIHDFPYALYGSMLVGALCAFIGVYIVAKRIVFLGAVLTQVSVLGIAITFLPMFAFVNHTLGSLLFTLIAVIVFSKLLTEKNIPKDAMLGFSFVFAIAFRILIMQKTPKVEVVEIESLLRGDILFVVPETFYGMLAVFVVVMAMHVVFFKEFTYISFDAETARAQGFRADAWELLFYLTAGVVISVATHMVGDAFVFGFLIIPPITALLLTRNVKRVFFISMLIGALAPPIGLYLAFHLDFPSSPTMIAVAAVMLVCAWGIRQTK